MAERKQTPSEIAANFFPALGAGLSRSTNLAYDRNLREPVNAAYNLGVKVNDTLNPPGYREMAAKMAVSTDPAIASANEAGKRFYGNLGGLLGDVIKSGNRDLFPALRTNASTDKAFAVANDAGNRAYGAVGSWLGGLMSGLGDSMVADREAQQTYGSTDYVTSPDAITAAKDWLSSLFKKDPEQQQEQQQEQPMQAPPQNNEDSLLASLFNKPSSSGAASIPSMPAKPAAPRSTARDELNRILQSFTEPQEQKVDIPQQALDLLPLMKLVDTWTGSKFSKDYVSPIDQQMQREYLKSQTETLLNRKSEAQKQQRLDVLQALARLDESDANNNLRRFEISSSNANSAANRQQQAALSEKEMQIRALGIRQDMDKRGRVFERLTKPLGALAEPTVAPTPENLQKIQAAWAALPVTASEIELAAAALGAVGTPSTGATRK